MKLAERTFKRNDYKITSKFGYRNKINTSQGLTSSFHSGTDYATNGEKWAQYALENGVVSKVFTDDFGAKCVYIDYNRLNIRLFYAHLDSVCVKKGQKVNESTIIGYTGKTGKATGIHLHLGLKKIGNAKWVDPEKYDYREKKKQESSNFLGSRGYLKFGDKGANINKICWFFVNNFYGYFGNTKESAKIKLVGVNGDGDYFGEHLKKWVVEFQKRAKVDGVYGDVLDGNIGPLTLNALKKYGFKETE